MIATVLAAAEQSLDPFMFGHGFSRAKSSRIYQRSMRDAVQRINLGIEIHPKDNPNAAAAIYPEMEVSIPSVDDVLAEMIGDDLGLLEGVTGGVSRQPIEFLAEKQQSARWYIFQADSVPGVVDELKDFIARWVLPLFDDYVSADAVVLTNERDDRRIVEDRAQLMRVVSAAMVLGRADWALALMEARIGTVGARARYKRVYDYIQSRR